MSQQDDTNATPRTYRIQQLGPPRDRDGDPVRAQGRGLQQNETVTGFDSLVLHHPGDNRAARMENGVVVDGKNGRAFGYVGGQLQDIAISCNSCIYGLRPESHLALAGVSDGHSREC